jgi:hypothetical protein
VDSATGYEYDLDSNRHSTVAAPQIIKGADGKVIKVIARSTKEAKRLGRSLIEKGIVKGIAVKHRTRELHPPLSDVRIKIGAEMRQMAVKMCVGLTQLLLPSEVVIDSVCRTFLLEEAPQWSPVRQFFHRHTNLDALRPGLAHTIYVEGDPTTGRCYGIVQLFGIFQFYVPLNSAYHGAAFAALGVLDVTSRQEQFSLRDPLRVPEPPLHIPAAEYILGLDQLGDEINRQICQAFGAATITFGACDTQSLNGFRFRIPLLWIEYAAAVELELDLIPDRANDKVVTIPKVARNWVFSSDFGLRACLESRLSRCSAIG